MTKLGRYVLVTEFDVSRAERFLEGRGMWAIPVGRMLPFVRAFTSIVAWPVRVPAGKFGILSLIGTVVYATVISLIGYALGSTWQSVSHGLAVAGYVMVALVVVAIAAFITYRGREVRREEQHPRAVAAPGPPNRRRRPRHREARRPRPPALALARARGRTRTGRASQRPRSASS